MFELMKINTFTRAKKTQFSDRFGRRVQVVQTLSNINFEIPFLHIHIKDWISLPCNDYIP